MQNLYRVYRALELSFFDCLLVLQVELILCIKWLKAIPDLFLEECQNMEVFTMLI